MKTPEIKLDVIAAREGWRKLPDYGCFWSSPDNVRGFRLTPTIVPGRVSVEMTIEREQSGFPGIAHGGVAFTILDGLMGWYIMAHEGRAGFTTRAVTDYKAPLVVGKRYLFEAVLDESVRDLAPGLLPVLGRVVDPSLPEAKRRPMVEVRAQFILPNRALARKIMGIELGPMGEALFPEE